MNALTSLLALAATCLAALIIYEVRPAPAVPSDPVISPGQPISAAPPALPAARESNAASLADTLLARPLFSPTRRAPNVASPAAAPAAGATKLPRMTGILIDGSRRSVIFAAPAGDRGGKPTIAAEGGRVGAFTIQTIGPEQVIVIGPDGKHTVRTSFDPNLTPPAPQLPAALAAPQFPGITIPGAPPAIPQPPAPSAAYGLPQSAGAAR